MSLGSSRRGLKRIGLRCWRITGDGKTMLIEKDSPRRWPVWPETQARFPGGFMVMEFDSLGEARCYAELEVGAMPYFLRRAG